MTEAQAEAAPAVTLDMAKFQRFVYLKGRANEIAAMAEENAEEIKTLEQDLLAQFIEADTDSIRVSGRTVYLSRTVWARREDGVEQDDLNEALFQAGLGHFVKSTTSSQTLSAYLRDLEKEKQPLPEALQGVLGTSEVFHVMVRGGSRKS